MCEATIKELCYLISFKIGERITYTVEDVFPRMSKGDFAFIIINGKVKDLSWWLSVDDGDGQDIVNSDEFNAMMYNSICRIKEEL